MDPFHKLSACVGNWRGTNTLQDPHTNVAVTSPTTATVAPTAGRVRLDYTWAYQDKPQQGFLLFGADDATGVLTVKWTDTWHTNNRPMVFTGPKPPGTALSVRGTYAAPPGPDWGWRIDVTSDVEHLHIVMWNIWPQEQGGKEELAVEAVYARE